MSFFKKLFGGSKPAEQQAPAPPAGSQPAPAVSEAKLARAGELIDCGAVDWNAQGQLDFLRDVLAPHGTQRLLAVLADSRFKGNEWYSPIDGAVLYAVIGRFSPTRIMEVGAGHSTFIMRRALEHHNLPAELIAIDPQPRCRIDDLTDAHLDDSLLDVPPADFEIMIEGELVHLDTDHIVAPGSHVEYLYDAIIPVLKPGLLVGIHGVRLPREYTRGELEQGFSEQDRVLRWLSSNPRVEVLYAGAWLLEAHREELLAALPETLRAQPETTALWLRLRA